MSSANQTFHNRSRVAIDSTSWNYQACTRDTLWCQHYVTISKEYLINCYILLQYFELVFLQLQLAKYCVNWSSFDWIMKNKTKRGPFLCNTVYFRCQPSTLLQNFIHLRQSAAELLLFVQKSKMAAAAVLNYNFVMLDHPRSPFVHLKFPSKFRVDRVRTFRDIAIRKFRKFGLKCLLRPPKSRFGEFWPLNITFYHRHPKRHYLAQKHAFWALISHDRSYDVTWTRGEEYRRNIIRLWPIYNVVQKRHKVYDTIILQPYVSQLVEPAWSCKRGISGQYSVMICLLAMM